MPKHAQDADRSEASYLKKLVSTFQLTMKLNVKTRPAPWSMIMVLIYKSVENVASIEQRASPQAKIESCEATLVLSCHAFLAFLHVSHLSTRLTRAMPQIATSGRRWRCMALYPIGYSVTN